MSHVRVHVALRDAALLVRVGRENEEAEVSASGQKGVWSTRAQEISCFDCDGTMHVCMRTGELLQVFSGTNTIVASRAACLRRRAPPASARNCYRKTEQVRWFEHNSLAPRLPFAYPDRCARLL